CRGGCHELKGLACHRRGLGSARSRRPVPFDQQAPSQSSQHSWPTQCVRLIATTTKRTLGRAEWGRRRAKGIGCGTLYPLQQRRFGIKRTSSKLYKRGTAANAAKLIQGRGRGGVSTRS